MFILLHLNHILTNGMQKGMFGFSRFKLPCFGHFYSECEGEYCVEIFKLENGKLFEDTTDVYPSRTTSYIGEYVQLSEQKYFDTKDLFNDFPQELLDEKSIVIGKPDISDLGGIYIEYNCNGKSQFWLIDQVDQNVPTKYHVFIDKINEKIWHLQ